MNDPNDPAFVAAVRAAIAQKMREQSQQRTRWGEQGPPVSTIVRDLRVVAAYNEVLTIRPDATYHDFLGLFLIRIFGQEWWQEELEKTIDQRHPVVSWGEATREFMAQNSTGQGGINEAPMTPEAGHILRLAFNLHQIRHLGLLLPSMVKRLKIKQQFQGARYETAVVAAFARAGFEVELEPEGKGPNKLCEFVATHTRSKRRYSVEAKSRHRPGVLGQPDGQSSTRPEPQVEGLIAPALGKKAHHDRVICIDVNYPEIFQANPPIWIGSVRRQVDNLENRTSTPAILIFTNSPFHYLPANQSARGECSVVMGLNEPRFRPEDVRSVSLEFPGLVEVSSSFMTPIPGRWD